MQLPNISGGTYAMIGGGVIAASGYAGHVVGQTKDGDSKAAHVDLGRNMLIGAGILGAANLGAGILLPRAPLMLLATGAGALAGAAYTLGLNTGASRVGQRS